MLRRQYVNRIIVDLCLQHIAFKTNAVRLRMDVMVACSWSEIDAIKVTGHKDEPNPVGNQGRHYSDVILGTMAFQITSLTIVNSTVYSGADQRKHQSSASLAFVRGIYWWPVNSPHKGPVTRKMFPFDDVTMLTQIDVDMMKCYQSLWNPSDYLNCIFLIFVSEIETISWLASESEVMQTNTGQIKCAELLGSKTMHIWQRLCPLHTKTQLHTHSK